MRAHSTAAFAFALAGPALAVAATGSDLFVSGGKLYVGEKGGFVDNPGVYVKAGRVKELGGKAPAGVAVLDARGRYVSPGVTDARVQATRFPQLDLWAYRGVTTVLDTVGGDISFLSGIASRQRLNFQYFEPWRSVSYSDAAADLFYGGYVLSAEGAPPGPPYGLSLKGDPATMKKVVAQEVEDGAALVLVALEHLRGPTFSDAALAAVVEEAHAVGRRAVAIAGDAEDVGRALDAGFDLLAGAPGERLPDALIARAARQCALIASLDAADAVARAHPHDLAATGPFEAAKANVGRFAAAGGRVVVGSGYGIPGAPAGMPVRELELLREAGLTGAQAFAGAEDGLAEAVGIPWFGSLAPGALGDVVVTDADPTQDPRTLAMPYAVVKRGRALVAPGVSQPVTFELSFSSYFTSREAVLNAAAQDVAPRRELRFVVAVPYYDYVSTDFGLGAWIAAETARPWGVVRLSSFGSWVFSPALPHTQERLSFLKGYFETGVEFEFMPTFLRRTGAYASWGSRFVGLSGTVGRTVLFDNARYVGPGEDGAYDDAQANVTFALASLLPRRVRAATLALGGTALSRSGAVTLASRSSVRATLDFGKLAVGLGGDADYAEEGLPLFYQPAIFGLWANAFSFADRRAPKLVYARADAAYTLTTLLNVYALQVYALGEWAALQHGSEPSTEHLADVGLGLRLDMLGLSLVLAPALTWRDGALGWTILFYPAPTNG